MTREWDSGMRTRGSDLILPWEGKEGGQRHLCAVRGQVTANTSCCAVSIRSSCFLIASKGFGGRELQLPLFDADIALMSTTESAIGNKKERERVCAFGCCCVMKHMRTAQHADHNR